MNNDLASHMEILRAEIVTDEGFADEIAGLARRVKHAGLNEIADAFFNTSRQLRIKALDLQGRLAAVSRRDRDVI